MKLVKQVHIKNRDPKPLVVETTKRNILALHAKRRRAQTFKDSRREADWKKEQYD